MAARFAASGLVCTRKDVPFMTLLIQAANIEYAYGGNDVLTGATFEIRQGDRLALIGANGSGKSTLFRLMAGQLRPQRGTLTLARGTRVGFLTQEAEFDPDQTVREAIALAVGDPAALEARARELEQLMGEAACDDELTAIMDAYAVVLERLDGGAETAQGDRVLSGLGFPEARADQPISQLSGGEKKLIGLARLLIEEPDVLLLDEPDNHLDFAGKSWLEGYVRDHRGAVAIISHDRYFIDRAANRIFELEKGRVEGYTGNYAAYVAAKRARLERGAQLRELQEREFRKLKANAERGSTLVLDAKGIAKSFGERVVLEPFDLEIRHGEAVGLVGANGSGKTTLFPIIRNEELPSSGTLRACPSVLGGGHP